MNSSIYLRLKETALTASQRLGQPSFYGACRTELGISQAMLLESEVIHRCRSYLEAARLHPAHGIFHCEKVAVEAGALVRVEGEKRGYKETDTRSLMSCAQVAGMLHDITRNGKDHTVTGSMEAALILRDVEMSAVHKRYVVAAIRNHEAFKEAPASCDEHGKLVSDCLYDADKFRWGPDNFTTTLWLITESSGMSPETLYHIFREKMGVIARIRGTFRTATGKKYGPEFIDMGMEIGDEIYRELGNILGD